MNLQSCSRRPWKIGSSFIDEPVAVIMGILNVTPDSFFDGGAHTTLSKQYDRAHEMISQGARIIDIGGESSRPGAKPVSEQEELNRVIPIIEKLTADGIPNIYLSIDTVKSAVAKAACAAGAHVINDISALNDPAMAETIIATGASVVLNHIQGTPETMQINPHYQNVCTDVIAGLEKSILTLTQKGYPLNKICIDPGIGFGKQHHDNLTLIWNMNRLSILNCPILMGMSRKSYIAKTPGLEDSDRLIPSIASAVVANIAGASVIRVHDVVQTKEALSMTSALQNSGALHEQH